MVAQAIMMIDFFLDLYIFRNVFLYKNAIE